MLTYEIGCREVEIPEVDRFLADYAVLCKRHRMQFVVEHYPVDVGGGYVTLGAFHSDDDGRPILESLNLDHADSGIPCIARVKAAVESR